MGCKFILYFYGCLELRFLDVEVNPGPRAVLQCCRVMFTNINDLHGYRDEIAIAATKFDVVDVLRLKGGLHGATWCVYTHHVYTGTRNEAHMSPSQGSQLRFTEMSS